MIHYCTYFDRNYLTRGLALHRSLLRHGGPFVLWILCFDDETYETLAGFAEPSIRPIRLGDFERGDAELAEAKANRTLIEYYFTCTPSLVRFVFDQQPDTDMVTYLDADLLFFDDPQRVFDDLGDGSIAIVGHRFPPRLRHLEAYGRFNVGLVSFRADESGRACLARWRDQCLAWCYDRIEDGRFADQKYLDDWPEAFSGVRVLDDPGIGLAPWNFTNSEIFERHGRIQVDGHPLVFYHYHSFRELSSWLYDLGLAAYGQMPRPTRRLIYSGYIDALREAQRDLRSRNATDAQARHSTRYARIGLMTVAKRLVLGQLMVVAGRLRA